MKFHDLNEVSTEEVALEYPRTMAPPKKYLFPPEEVLYRYSAETSYKELVLKDEPPILFGLHSYDLHGIRFTDTFFRDHYLRRHGQSRILGLAYMPDEKCFYQSNRTDHIKDIYDLFLWEVEGIPDNGPDTSRTRNTLFPERFILFWEPRANQPALSLSGTTTRGLHPTDAYL